MNHAKEADDNLDFVTVQWSSGSPGLKVSCRLTFKNHTRNFISLLLWIIHLLRSDPVRSGPLRPTQPRCGAAGAFARYIVRPAPCPG